MFCLFIMSTYLPTPRDLDSLEGLALLRVKEMYKLHTLPETNIAPENRPLEKEIPSGNRRFWGLW